MAATREDAAVIKAFLDALREAREAAEFERLMLAAEEDTPPANEVIDSTTQRIQDRLDAMVADRLTEHFDDRRSALDELKGAIALERLQERYPELWEQVAVHA